MSIQQSIAHYRIISKLGEGGMGAVYRATDTKLNRDVAIKLLPDSFAADPDRLARFEREAQVLASLNHPNIAAIYGIEQGAIVMELVDGEDLRGPVPLDTALEYARQIAAGLEAAHEKGIVHRDLKPANIKVTPDGTVKLLDFGLAKASGGAAPAGSDTQSPTMSLAMTQVGMILGTAAYMAPEQARGKPVDKRADIWAFGVVFFEMLTGRALFGGGETVTDTIAAVVTREPAWSALPEGTPRHIRRLLERCLRKDPRLRLRDIGEARILLDEPEPATPMAAPIAATRSRFWPAAAIVCALAAVAIAAAWLNRSPAESGAGPVRFSLPFPPGTLVPTSGAATQWVPSPDGRNIAMVVLEASGKSAIWVRTLSDQTAHRLDKTEGGELPFWSPDGKSIAFFTEDRLKRLELSGGGLQTICDLTGANAVSAGDGGTWNREGIIVFSAGRRNASGLMRVPATGGAAEPATALGSGEIGHSWPQFLADGRHFLYLARARDVWSSGIYVQELGSAKRVLVMKSATRAVWSPSGYLLFTRDSTLLAQKMNLNGFRLEGEALPLQEDVVANVNNGRSTVAVSQTGVLVYRTGTRAGDRQLSWRDRDGKVVAQIGSPVEFFTLSLSPDGKSLALVISHSSNPDVWVMDIATGVMVPMTHDGRQSSLAPVWSPDSKRIAVSSADNHLMVIDVASARITASPNSPCAVQDWSPDGNSILCTNDEAGKTRAFLSPLAEGGQEQTIFTSPYTAVFFRFSPDGKYVAYASSETGSFEIYVAALSSSAARRRVSNAGGSFPIWARETNELFYRSTDGKLMEVEVRTGPNIEAGLPKPLFPFGAGSVGNRFAVSADGRRFVISEFVKKAEIDRPEINVMLNWTELRK